MFASKTTTPDAKGMLTMNTANNPFNPGYYHSKELRQFGFLSVGDNVQIAKNCTIIGLENINIGHNVRIDGYCTLIANGKGWIELGSYIHIGSSCLLSAGCGIRMEDFTCLSHGVKVYSKNDDYSGKNLTNPTVPEAFTGVTGGPVILERHALVGSGCVILPNLHIEEGVSVGALSLVRETLPAWHIYAGCPAKQIKPRSRDLLSLEKLLLASTQMHS